ncbi:MAG: reverse transcriptase domain-containing protein [Bacilli bacterium]|nr:reverse transcriptase domain-containing protein [Bacilli bacterium]
MKRQNNLYEKIVDTRKILDIYNRQIKKSTKNKEKIERFEQYLMINIAKIETMLKNKNVSFNKYKIFLIRDPKYRVIMSQSVGDKIINHLVAKYFLLDIFEKILIDENVATRKGKGTTYGINLIKKYINDLKKQKKPIYYLKCDVSKYFYNIDHNTLKKIISKKIKDKSAIELINKIIDTFSSKYVNKEVNDVCNKEIEYVNSLNIMAIEKQQKIKDLEKIKATIKDKKGIPIGDMTSQAFAIIYLNELDHYIKENLKIKYYVRYMDDLIILNNNKEKLKEDLNKVKEKIEDEYLLELNNKTQIGMLKNGLDCLGFRFILSKDKIYLKVRTKTKKRFKKKVRKLSNLIIKGKISEKSYYQLLASYKGHLINGNTYKLYSSVANKGNDKVNLGENVYIDKFGEIIKG